MHVGTRRLRRLLGGAIIGASLLAVPAGASAADQVVSDTGNAGPGTLRQAIVDAGDNDTITFDVTGTIQLESVLLINEDLTIAGPGADALIVSGGLGFRVFTVDNATSTISDLTVANGHPRASGASDQFEEGGGILNSDGDLTLDRVVVRDNTAEAVANGAGNSATAEGGGVANRTDFFTELTVVRSSFRDNRVLAETDGADAEAFANAEGGAIFNDSGGHPSVDASTFSNNTAEARAENDSNAHALGGAIHLADSVSRISRSTMAGNAADALPDGPDAVAVGGGVFSNSNALFFADGMTIARNRAAVAANVSVSPNSQFSGTIVADPVGPGGNCGENPISNGYNIEDDGSCGFSEPTDQSIDPLLAANLSANGGPTPTLALLAGSPAIDQGIALGKTTDQRGLPRPSDFAEIANLADGSDVGAFELQAPAPETPLTPRTPGPDCRGHEATIVGTNGGETITGTDEIDVIVAAAGNDQIRGLAGNDVLCGGDGRDLISGGTGFDKLEGQAGNDRLNGGTGRDKLFGQAGADRLKGAGGRDTCRGGGSRDVAVACEIKRTL